jgi:toxin ParE1/3/4
LDNGRADDLERIYDYIAEAVLIPHDEWHSPWSSASTLETFPHLGRPGRVEGTREIAFPALPFIAIYEVLETRGEVWMLRILHGAQQWPPR